MVDSAQFVTDLTTIGDGSPHMIGYAQNAQAGYLEAPTNAQQQDGVVPLDRLPAQWWNWFLNQATRRFSEAETYIEKAIEELDGVLDVMGVSPDSTDQTQLKTMFGSTYLQNYLPKIAETATAFSPDGTHSNSLIVTDDDGNSVYSIKKVPYAPGLVVNTQIATATKNIALPSNCPYDGQSIKVVFVGGHEASSSTDYMTLDVNNSGTPAPLVSNQNGTLDYLRIHQITSGTYSVLQTNTALEMYYTATGFNGNPAWVVVCNPVVLSSTDYTFYANGQKTCLQVGAQYTSASVTTYSTSWTTTNFVFSDVPKGKYQVGWALFPGLDFNGLVNVNGKISITLDYAYNGGYYQTTEVVDVTNSGQFIYSIGISVNDTHGATFACVLTRIA